MAADRSAFVMDGYRRRMLEGGPFAIACPQQNDGNQADKARTLLVNEPLDKVVIRLGTPCCTAPADRTGKAVEGCGPDTDQPTVPSASG